MLDPQKPEQTTSLRKPSPEAHGENASTSFLCSQRSVPTLHGFALFVVHLVQNKRRTQPKRQGKLKGLQGRGALTGYSRQEKENCISHEAVGPRNRDSQQPLRGSRSARRQALLDWTKWPCRMATSEEQSEAPTEPLDVACGLENLPVSVWPPGTGPEPFQVGGGARPPKESCGHGASPPAWGGALKATGAARSANRMGVGPSTWGWG